MPTAVIRVVDPHAFPFELGFTPTQDFDRDTVSAIGKQVRTISLASVVVTSASGDPGVRPIIRHMVPSLTGPGAEWFYVRADSQSAEDLLVAAHAMHEAVVAHLSKAEG